MTTKLASILNCYAMGMGVKGISITFEFSRNTVCRSVRLFQESDISIEQLLTMPASRIQEMFGDSDERKHTSSQHQIELKVLLPEYSACSQRYSQKRHIYRNIHFCRCFIIHCFPSMIYIYIACLQILYINITEPREARE